MQLNYAQKSDTGLQRKNNQDYLGVFSNASDVLFFAMADGVAGTNQGNIASKTVIDFLGETWEKSKLTSIDQIQDFLINQSKSINQKLRKLSKDDAEELKMSTTFVGLVFVDQQVLSINVGDSRAYQFTDNKLIQLSQDHLFAAEMIKSGGVDSAQAANIQNGDKITRYFGSDTLPEFDTKVVQAKPNDQFLLSTDGLTKQVKESEIIKILQSENLAENKADQLINQANQNGGFDNVSVIVIEVQS